MAGHYSPTTSAHDRLRVLAAAHRAAQTDHRAALAAEDRRGIEAADRRAHAALSALTELGACDLTAHLTAETRSGDALIIALTCESSHRSVLDHALDDYRRERERVHALLSAPTAPVPQSGELQPPLS